MTNADRKILMLGAGIIAFASIIPLLLADRLTRPMLVSNILLAFFVWFIAWSTEPEDPDDPDGDAGLEEATS